jgi:mannose-6-phosphate isomerase-like protein (cupin superfamily)
MSQDNGPKDYGFFDVLALAKSLPETAQTLLADRYLTDRDTASVRVFRVYRPVPAHYHVHCDEHLYIISGKGSFWMGDPSSERILGVGELVVFPKKTVHAIPVIAEEPLVFLSIDTPRRIPTDIVFVNASDGTAETFMERNSRS